MKKRVKILLFIFVLLICLALIGIAFIDFEKFPLNLELNGKSEIKININDEYIDEGINATLFWIDISNKVLCENNIDNTTPGVYSVKYTYKSKLFNRNLERKVIVVDNIAPSLTLEKDKISIYTNGVIDIGKVKAKDNIDGDISKNIVIENDIDTSKAGNYKINVSITDSSGNKEEKSIDVKIKERPVKNGSVNARIDVYISEQKLYYFENNKLVLTSDVVTGKKDGTPKGNYKVLRKKKDIYLKGDTFLDHVDYWIAFIGGLYGIHDASWRNEFGGNIYKTNGSHGCVNMPINNMKKLYDKVKVGTAVNIYD